MKAAAHAPRVNGMGGLTLLAQGSQVSAQLFDLRAGPLTLYVNRFSGGELVLSANFHRMLMEGLIDFEQRGEDPDDRASWWYVITTKGRQVLDEGGESVTLSNKRRPAPENGAA